MRCARQRGRRALCQVDFIRRRGGNGVIAVIDAPRENARQPLRRWRGRGSAAGLWLVGALVLSAAAGCSSNADKDVPQLVEDSQQADAAARYTAVKSLGNRGAEAKEAVPAIIAR